MASTIIFDDYVLRNRTAFLVDDDSMAQIKAVWDEQDPMLVKLNVLEMFKGKTRWSHLESNHWRLLITNAFNKRDAAVKVEEHFDDKIPEVEHLFFLITGLAMCLSTRTGSTLDVLRVMRISEIDLTLEMTMVMMSQPKKIAPPAPKSGFHVVVDNT